MENALMARFAFLPLLVLLAPLAACARSEDASVVANSEELNAVEQVRTREQDDQEIAIGDWRESLQDENAALEFGPTGAPPLFSLRCDARNSVFLQRHGAAPGGDVPMMLVTIGSESRRLAVTNVGGIMPMLRASLAPSDTLIRTLTTTTTPIVIRIGDTPPLVLPPSTNIGGFLGRCGNEPRGAAPGGEAVGNAAATTGNEAAPPPPAPARR
jgi:hypothetical protein